MLLLQNEVMGIRPINRDTQTGGAKRKMTIICPDGSVEVWSYSVSFAVWLLFEVINLGQFKTFLEQLQKLQTGSKNYVQNNLDFQLMKCFFKNNLGKKSFFFNPKFSVCPNSLDAPPPYSLATIFIFIFIVSCQTSPYLINYTCECRQSVMSNLTWQKILLGFMYKQSKVQSLGGGEGSGQFKLLICFWVLILTLNLTHQMSN